MVLPSFGNGMVTHRQHHATSGNYDGQRKGQRGIHALWETLQESHAMAADVLNAELEWRAVCAAQGHGFRRRGRTMTLLPTPEALALWDSLTHGHTWPRYYRAAERIAAAWHSAWVDAGRPHLHRTPKRPWQERLALYLPPQWRSFLLPHSHDTPSPAPMDP